MKLATTTGDYSAYHISQAGRELSFCFALCGCLRRMGNKKSRGSFGVSPWTFSYTNL